MKIIRVFPCKTKATPTDEMAVIGYPGLFDAADRVLVSCAFTWNIPEAERLAKAWECVAPVELGGPAFGNPGEQFTPGMFLREGYTITSRGCPNKCWFCYAWKRSGKLRELEIKDGWIVQDDNLLACSEKHIRSVFEMLKRQPKKAVFAGGLESRLLKDWHIDLLVELRPQQVFFAYDTDDDYEPLREASVLLKTADLLLDHGAHRYFCYNLVGYPGDTFEQAQNRLKKTLELGFTPFAMLYRNDSGETKREWRKFQRSWARPAAIYRKG